MHPNALKIVIKKAAPKKNNTIFVVKQRNSKLWRKEKEEHCRNAKKTTTTPIHIAKALHQKEVGSNTEDQNNKMMEEKPKMVCEKATFSPYHKYRTQCHSPIYIYIYVELLHLN